jgi:DNA-binding transcriptional MerR regulator
LEYGNIEPLYNIGVVSRMTGISMATLRAWERRYNFPESERTAGGHRLYSERDVMRLRWVKARIDEGMQTAQAINALRHQETTGHLILTPGANPSLTQSIGSTSNSEGIDRYAVTEESRLLALEEGHSYLTVFRDRLREALLRRDLDAADEALGAALAVSTPEDMILKVISPNIASIGDDWERGAIGVAVEHLATNYLRQRMLNWMLSGPPPRHTRPIVLTCAPDEWHEGSLLVLGALLRRRRWPVAYLGQALPLNELSTFVSDINPDLVVMVAMTEKTAETMAEWPQWLPDAYQKNHPIVGYGGRVFMLQPEWRLRIPGIYLGNSFEEGVATIERLLDHRS